MTPMATLKHQHRTVLSTIGFALPYPGIVVFTILLVVLSFKREVLNYGTETDFLATFVPEAMRFLNQQALQLEFHPPFYSIILASIFSITGEWMKSGLILSLCASFVAMISCYKFFQLEFGKIAAIGALISLSISETFISYSMQATSDIFFIAIFFSALASIALARVNNIGIAWLLAGILIGMAILTRTNGIALMGFILFPITLSNIEVSKAKSMVLLITGMLTPIAIWSLFALYSRSPIFPTSNYKNLALTYFSENNDRISGDNLLKASADLTNTWDVLMNNPMHITKIYIRDLFSNTKRLLTDENLLPFPFIQLALPGFYLLIFKRFNIFDKILLFSLLEMFLLLNLKAWENRYFLYIVPFMGAGITSLFTQVYLGVNERNQNMNLYITMLVCTLSFIISIQHMKHLVSYRSHNLAFDAIEASKILKDNFIFNSTIVISRKPHLRFYANSESYRFPDVETIADLKIALEKIVAVQDKRQQFYLFYGSAETKYRPKLLALKGHDLNIAWLHRIGEGTAGGGWVLYEILRNGF